MGSYILELEGDIFLSSERENRKTGTRFQVNKKLKEEIDFQAISGRMCTIKRKRNGKFQRISVIKIPSHRR